MAVATAQNKSLDPFQFTVTVEPELIAFFRDVLHIRRGKQQDRQGHYIGANPRKITEARLSDHLAGRETWAFATALNGESWFIAFDVDAHFAELLPLIREVLTKHELDRATFLTGGSDTGRGKVVVVFARSIEQSRVGKFIRQLWQEVRMAGGFHLGLRPLDVSLYPADKGKSVLRIGGRHRTRSILCDRLSNFDGSPFTPETLVPAKIDLGGGRRTEVLPTRKLHRGVLRIVQNGIDVSAIQDGNESRRRILAQLTKVALDVQRVHGTGLEAEGIFWSLFEKIEAKSERAAAGVTRNKAASAWKKATESRTKVTLEKYPLTGIRSLLQSNVTHRRVLRLVRAVYRLMDSLGLSNPKVLCLSVEQVAKAYGASRPATHRAMRAAETAGVLVYHDRGSRHGRKGNGDKSLFGIVIPPETPASVVEYGLAHPMVVARLAKRRAIEAKRSQSIVTLS
jgi:hypothetical protein